MNAWDIFAPDYRAGAEHHNMYYPNHGSKEEVVIYGYTGWWEKSRRPLIYCFRNLLKQRVVGGFSYGRLPAKESRRKYGC